MPVLLQDVFGSDLFSTQQLTDAINTFDYLPGRAGSLGIFEEEGIATTSIVLEEQDGALALIPDTQRGAPPQQNKMSKRVARTVMARHWPLEDTVMASEVQNVRAFGGSELQGIQQVRDRKLLIMGRKHMATLEYQRIGAIKGVLLDSDGSTTIYNLFTEFGVTEQSTDFVLGTSTTETKLKCLDVSRSIEDALKADMYDHIHCFAGKTWFGKFITHATVKDAYDRWQAGQFKRDDNRRGFEYCGIFFEEYRGTVGAVDFVPATEARFFPVGVPGLFKTVFAPGDFVEAANTIGLPMYSKSERMEYDRGVKMLTESNPLTYCTRPKVLHKGTTSN